MPKSSSKIFIIEERCKSCGLCIHYCPQGCLKLSEKFNTSGYHPVIFISTDYTDKRPDYTDKKGCNSCGFCYLICPDVCVEVYK